MSLPRDARLYSGSAGVGASEMTGAIRASRTRLADKACATLFSKAASPLATTKRISVPHRGTIGAGALRVSTRGGGNDQKYGRACAASERGGSRARAKVPQLPRYRYPTRVTPDFSKLVDLYIYAVPSVVSISMYIGLVSVTRPVPMDSAIRVFSPKRDAAHRTPAAIE